MTKQSRSVFEGTLTYDSIHRTENGSKYWFKTQNGVDYCFDLRNFRKVLPYLIMGAVTGMFETNGKHLKVLSIL